MQSCPIFYHTSLSLFRAKNPLISTSVSEEKNEYSDLRFTLVCGIIIKEVTASF